MRVAKEGQEGERIEEVKSWFFDKGRFRKRKRKIIIIIIYNYLPLCDLIHANSFIHFLQSLLHLRRFFHLFSAFYEEMRLQLLS
jgi:hypothetical protein